MKASRGTRILTASAAVALALYPSVISLRIAGISSCFSSFAADAFYYLAIAKNLAWEPVFSFDTLHPTNGFHPLWQVYLKSCFSIFPLLSEDQTRQLLFAYWTGTICVAASAALLSLSLFRITRCAALALITVVPGILYFPLALANQRYGALWSYINGTESAFSLVLFACLVALMIRFRVYSSGGFRPCVIASLLVSLLVLARLDDVFLIPALIVPLSWSRTSLRRKLAKAGILAGFPALIVLAYCLFNLAYAGTLLPVSGQIKGGPGCQFNSSVLRNVVFPLRELGGNDWRWWSSLTWRALHNFVPAVISIAFLCAVARRAAACRRFPGNSASLLSALCMYVVGKAAYNFVFVGFWHQGHWYYPLSICTGNILLAVLVSREVNAGGLDFNLSIPLHCRFVRVTCSAFGIACSFMLLLCVLVLAMGHSVNPVIGRYSWSRMMLMGASLGGGIASLIGAAGVLRRSVDRVKVPIGLGIVALFVLYAANAMMSEKADSRYNQNYYLFWQHRQRTSREIRQRYHGTGILSFDDGIIAYSLDIPVMSGLGCALDVSAMRAKQSGRLLDVAYQRGFRWLTSLNYMPSFTAMVGDDVTESIRGAFWFQGENPNTWTFKLAYVQPESGCRFIEFKPTEDRATRRSIAP